MPLADITSRILERARAAAAEILSEAQRESEAALREAAERIERDEARDGQRTADEAQAVEQRAVAAARLEAKKENLAARQEMIDAVLAEAMRGLAAADEATWVAFFRARLLAAPMHGDAEILVADGDRGRLEKHLGALQQAIGDAGGRLRLRPAPPGTGLTGGFVLRQGRVEFNASLEAVRKSREEELRAAASALLFPEE